MRACNIFQQVKGKALNLRLHVSRETAGRYICKATVNGYPEIEAGATVFIKGEIGIFPILSILRFFLLNVQRYNLNYISAKYYFF